MLSGIVFSGFTTLHLATHTAALWGLSAANFTLSLTRWVYQKSPAMELLFALSAVVHVFSSAGVKVVEYNMYKNEADKALQKDEGIIDSMDHSTAITRKKHHHKKTFFDFMKPKTTHQITGSMLSVFLIGHVFATRFYPWSVLPDPSIIDESYVVLTIQKMPVMVLYFGVLTFVGTYHMIHGLKLAFQYLKWTMYPKRGGDSNDNRSLLRWVIEGGSSLFHDPQRVRYMTSMVTVAVITGVLVLGGWVYGLQEIDEGKKAVYLGVMRGYTPEWVQRNVWRAV
jgi:succinate dehydrogenase/fumarate reductase cytochrome b subunit